jgi:hypothetical protein
MFCSKCGVAVDDDAKFCGNCGNAIASVTHAVEGASATSSRHSSNNQFAPKSINVIKKGIIAILIFFLLFGIYSSFMNSNSTKIKEVNTSKINEPSKPVENKPEQTAGNTLDENAVEQNLGYEKEIKLLSACYGYAFELKARGEDISGYYQQINENFKPEVIRIFKLAGEKSDKACKIADQMPVSECAKIASMNREETIALDEFVKKFVFARTKDTENLKFTAALVCAGPFSE